MGDIQNNLLHKTKDKYCGYWTELLNDVTKERREHIDYKCVSNHNLRKKLVDYKSVSGLRKVL